MSLRPGERLLHYVIERKLGEGGMGEVWLARDTRLERLVALKFLGRKAALEPEARLRLAREARAASALNHPNILTIYAVESAGPEAGEHAGRAFIAMEFAEGAPLDEWIQAQRPGFDQLLEIALQIGSGLAAAHEKGIVHRDVKPGNVMVSPDGRAQVMDFGLAKVSSEPQLTQTGSTLGTLAYMSPEQVKGQEVDARSDVFSFGAMLYELATGRSPFEREAGPAAVLHAILNDEALPVSRARPGLPRDLDPVLARALAKDRERRYPDLPAMLADLRALREQRPISSAGRSAGWRRLPLSGLAATVLALAAGLWWVQREPSEVPAPAPASSAEPAAQVQRAPAAAQEPEPPALEAAPRYAQRLLSLLRGSPHSGTLSPDGTMVAYVNGFGGIEQLYVTGLDEGEPRRLTQAERHVQRPRWQPRGNLILYQHSPDGESWADGQVFVVSALGGEPRLLLDEARQASWSHDGEQVVFQRDRGVWLAAADGSNPRHLDGLPPTPNPVVGQMPALSPDGEQVVFFCAELGPMGKLYLADLDGGNLRALSSEQEFARDASFTPDGRWVVCSSDTGGPRLLWRTSTAPGGPYPPQSITSGTGADSEPCVSADGRRILFTNARKEFVLQRWDPNAPETPVRVLRASRGMLLFPSWSPDGTRICSFGEGRQGSAQLLLLDAQGSSMTQLTNDSESTDIFPRWSADGEFVYYYRDNAGDASLRRIPVAGGASQLVAAEWTMQSHPFPGLSPDGRSIVTPCFRPNAAPQFLELDLETGDERPFPVPIFRPSFSETGERVLGEWPPGAMFMYERESGARTALGPGQVARFDAYGESVFFMVAEGDVWQLWRTDLSGEQREKVIDLGGMYEQSPWYDVSRYGEIVWSELRSSPRELWILDQQ